jgi:hypothetical protein
MTKIDDNLKYICKKCIFSILVKNNCSNGCEIFKCIACNSIYQLINNDLFIVHDQNNHRCINFPI